MYLPTMTINREPLINKNLSFSYRLSLAFLFLSFTYLVTNSPIPTIASSVGDLAQLGASVGRGADDVASGSVDAAKLGKNLGSLKSTSAADDVADLKNADSISDASKLRKTDLRDAPKFPDTAVQKTLETPQNPQQISKIVNDLDVDTAKLIDDVAKKSRGYITFGPLKIVRMNPGLQTTLEKIYMSPRKIKMALNALKIDRGTKEAMILSMSGDGAGSLKQLNNVEEIIAKNRFLRLNWADKIGRPYNIKHGSRFRWYKYIKFFGKRGKQYDDIIKNFKEGEQTPELGRAAAKIQAKNAAKAEKSEKLLKAKDAKQLRMKNYKANHPGLVKFFNRMSRQWKAFKDKLDFAKGKYHVKQPTTNPSTAGDVGEQTQNVGSDATRMQSGTNLAQDPTNPSTAADIGKQTQNVGAGVTRTQSGSDLAHSTKLSPGVSSSTQ